MEAPHATRPQTSFAKSLYSWSELSLDLSHTCSPCCSAHPCRQGPGRQESADRQSERTSKTSQTTRGPHPRHAQDKKRALSMSSTPGSFAIRRRHILRPQAPRPIPRMSAASREVEQRHSGAGEHRKQHGSKQEHPCPCPPCFLRPAAQCQHPALGGTLAPTAAAQGRGNRYADMHHMGRETPQLSSRKNQTKHEGIEHHRPRRPGAVGARAA